MIFVFVIWLLPLPASIPFAIVPLLLILLFMVRGTFTFASSYATNWVATKLVMDLRTQMFRKLITLPTPYYDNVSSGAVIANIAFNVTQVTAAGTNVVTVTVRDTFTILGLLAWMFYLKLSFNLYLACMSLFAD